MTEPRTGTRAPVRRAGRALAVLLTALVLALTVPTGTARHEHATTAAPPAQAAAALPRSEPRRIVIPRIGVDAPLTPVGLDRARRLMPPPLDRPALAGWYTGAPTPGSAGTAVTVGHLDSATGPAVFHRLHRLRPGDRLDVRRGDGRTAVFRVDAVRTYAKSAFPTVEVYAPRHGNRPELRTITCAGPYDPATGYASNVVVFSHLAGVRPTAASGQ
ncbi:class F sortase [Streptomyces sp. NPDC050658]|uniref:class F sortase n=1 Tax=unclassified Streptomyces TaxID=2593676 RepID=UPI0034395077